MVAGVHADACTDAGTHKYMHTFTSTCVYTCTWAHECAYIHAYSRGIQGEVRTVCWRGIHTGQGSYDRLVTVKAVSSGRSRVADLQPLG